MKRDARLAGHLLALFSVLVWGTTFISTKVLLRTLSPVEIMFVRFTLGFAALLLAGRGWLRARERVHELYFAAAGLTGVTLYFLLENIALTYAPASLVGVVLSVAPLFTAMASRLCAGGEPMGGWFLLGFVFAIAGVALVSVAGVSELHFHPLGAVLGILAALVWALYSTLVRRMDAFGYETAPLTCRVFFYGLLFLVPAIPLAGCRELPELLPVCLAPGNAANLLFLGLCASAACFVTWNRAVALIGPVRTSAYIYSQPVLTMVFSSILLHEIMTPRMLAGAALTLLGLVLSERHGAPRSADGH